MVPFELTTIFVGVAGIAACGTAYLRPWKALGELGRQGTSWFDHADDADIANRPADDAVDAPLPHRPLRARF